MGREDPTTQELRIAQRRREEAEREHAERAPEDEGTAQHEARAAKAEYLAKKLEDRAAAEREASKHGRPEQGG
jgi:hypothetical protein